MTTYRATTNRDGLPRKRTYTRGTPLERWLARVRPEEGGCWHWDGAHVPAGYGHFKEGPGKYRHAHAFGYEQLVGTVPEGLELDHLCRNRWCVNPDHLEAVDHRTNVRRGDAHCPTHCRRGHDITDPENRYERRDRPGYWNCRACVRERTAS